MQVPLRLDTIGELGGGTAGIIINKAIADAVFDIDDRGDDGKERQVLILLTLKKADNGEVTTHAEACAKVPRRRSTGTTTRVQRTGNQTELHFGTWSPDDPHQRTIDERLPPEQR